MYKKESHSISNIWDKINSKKEFKTNNVLCLWSDLLGFGNLLFERNWNLSENDIKLIYDRLWNAHTAFLRHTSPFIEKSLVLNDGLVKVSNIDPSTNPDIIGIFLRGCVWTHTEINKVEFESDYPGCRSILSFGQNIEYVEGDIKLDDYVLNYSKPDPADLGTLAKKHGNPIVVYNPEPFQMNTAFSKSYILDSLGSSYGIKGNKFYIEHSVIDFMKELAQVHALHFTEIQESSSLKILILKRDHHPSFGFEFDEIIDIDHKGWKTKVYRVMNFFPHDEDMREFKIEL
jgi:hypothetical protein